ncbi:oxygenase MpaB family protein [Rhodococcus sp. X156]|uniref:oxygenase MpaB family protein n=1 Tax=Rhodococcus sp. X156 TaxID=2499145 RepID=UPI000FD8E2B0|nr:oxygenase MpaB family protein [Rhodococcus sp. X156]
MSAVSNVAATDVAATSTEPRPLGPESMTWYRFGDWRTTLLTLWAGALQAMHPVIDTALVQHSDVFDNETARLARSSAPIVGALYDPTGEVARRVRSFHTEIRGETAEGQRYHALAPEPFYWAHATFLYTQYVWAEYFGDPLTEAQKEQLYAESVQWYALYGMPMQDVPATWADFQRYWDHVVTDVLVASETVRRSRALNDRMPERPTERIPRLVWLLAGPKLNRLLAWVTRGTLPPVARRKLGWDWSAEDERRLRRFGTVVRVAFRLLPPTWRLSPAARAAIRRHS